MASKLDQQRQKLASELDCCTSEELRALAGITPTTEERWRKTKVVDYILFGNIYLYPKRPLADRLLALTRQRKSVPPKACSDMARPERTAPTGPHTHEVVIALPDGTAKCWDTYPIRDAANVVRATLRAHGFDAVVVRAIDEPQEAPPS